jgi:hypothetical protein
MLALNSGLSGNWMSLLDLFTNDTSPQMKANAGEQVLTADRYFSRLKNHGAEYMRLSGFRFMPLLANDARIQGYIKHATGHGQTKGDSFIGSAEAFLRA